FVTCFGVKAHKTEKLDLAIFVLIEPDNRSARAEVEESWISRFNPGWSVSALIVSQLIHQLRRDRFALPTCTGIKARSLSVDDTLAGDHITFDCFPGTVDDFA